MSAPDLAAAGRMLSGALGDRLRRDEPLGPMTTYRVGGAAAFYVDAIDVDDLRAVARARGETGVPVLVVGRGSNMLVADTGFAGIAISIANFANHMVMPTEATPTEPVDSIEQIVAAGGGVALPVLARRTVAASLTGFEWAVGVPGSIGGAVRMNAGGHGSDLATCLVDVCVFDLDDSDRGLRTLPASDLGLRFRASDLAQSHIVHEARIRLRVGDRATAEQELADIVRWRREHQPGGQNCGSVFVNPVPGEVTAGALIDDLGLRGFTHGSAGVSDKHANFVQATDGGRAADVRAVIEHVRSTVAERTGYHLRSEVRLVGFDDADPSSFADDAADPESHPESDPESESESELGRQVAGRE